MRQNKTDRAATVTPDPVIALYQRFLQLEAEAMHLTRVRNTVNARLVERCGPPNALPDGRHIWDQNPEYSLVHELLERSDAFTRASLSVQEQLLATPPVSLDGLRAVLKFALSQQPDGLGAGEDWHFEVAISILNNVAAFVVAGEAAAQSRSAACDGGGRGWPGICMALATRSVCPDLGGRRG
jgi:hypothetical protein